MNLVTVDNRHPITIALNHAMSSEGVNPEKIVAWKGELIDLVAESARKFVGFEDARAVRRALDIVLGTLSLPLMHLSGGSQDPKTWAQHVCEKGLKGLVGEAIVLIKQLEGATIGSCLIATETGLSNRFRLIQYATSHDKELKTVWNGYSLFQRDRGEHVRNCIMMELTTWALSEIGKVTPQGMIARWRQDGRLDEHMPENEEILNTLIFKFCTNLPIQGIFTLRIEDFHKVQAEYRASKVKWMKNVTQRYRALVNKIPQNLLSGLSYGERDWFSRHLKDGPPAVSCRTVSEPPIQGIEGVYHCEIEM